MQKNIDFYQMLVNYFEMLIESNSQTIKAEVNLLKL